MTVDLPDEVGLMEGPSALPRDNGELSFAAPWEARALALAVALVRELGLEWDAFRSHLKTAVAEYPERPYYESWAAALESLILELDLTTPEAIGSAMPTERTPL